MIVSISASLSDTVMTTVPSPFVLINMEQVGTGLTQWTYIGIAGASEPASYDFVQGTTRTWACGMLAYSGSDSIDADDQQENVASTSLAHPALTTTDPNDMLIAATAQGVGTTTGAVYSHPVGWNTRLYVEPGAGAMRNTAMGDRLLSALNPGSYNVTSTISGQSAGQSIALLPTAETLDPPTSPTATVVTT